MDSLLCFKKDNIYFENGCPSPDSSGILSCPDFSSGQERYSGWLDKAPY
ncbi:MULTISPECIES: hypothetical protein [Flavobacterium]|nr:MULTISPECIES: hypothetical protein [Flavobacterium]